MHIQGITSSSPQILSTWACCRNSWKWHLWLNTFLIRSKFYSAIICIDEESDRKCEKFNTITSRKISPLKIKHWNGALGIYNGRPTAIGGLDAEGAAETLTGDGWTSVQTHPRYI